MIETQFFWWKTIKKCQESIWKYRAEIDTVLSFISPQFMWTRVKSWLNTEARFSTEMKSRTALVHFASRVNVLLLWTGSADPWCNILETENILIQVYWNTLSLNLWSQTFECHWLKSISYDQLDVFYIPENYGVLYPNQNKNKQFSKGTM